MTFRTRRLTRSLVVPTSTQSGVCPGPAAPRRAEVLSCRRPESSARALTDLHFARLQDDDAWMPFAGSEGLEDDEDPICLEKKIMQRGAFSHRRFHAEIGSNLNPKESTNLRISRGFSASQQSGHRDRELTGRLFHRAAHRQQYERAEDHRASQSGGCDKN